MKVIQRFTSAMIDAPIKKKMGLISSLVAGGVGLLVLLFIVVVLTQLVSDKKIGNSASFTQSLLEAKTYGLEARRSEKDFLLRKEAEYLDKVDKSVDLAEQAFEKARAEAPDQEAAERIKRIEAALSHYQELFRQAGKDQISAGLNENSGAHGKLRNAVHAMEDVINKENSLALKVSMLMMRRHEKDFIQRKTAKYLAEMAEEQDRFAALLSQENLSAAAHSKIAAEVTTYHDTFAEFVAATQRADAAIEAARNEFHKTEPEIDALVAASVADNENIKAWAKVLLSTLLAAGAALVALLILGLFWMLRKASDTLTAPVQHLGQTIQQLAEGDDTARTGMQTRDELGELGRAFDKMMDERVAIQTRIQKENEQLNDSVLSLLQGVAGLANKDLTGKVPVSEDVTGAVADALNLMSSETAKVLQSVSDISADVTAASLKVKQQSDIVSEVAEKEQLEVEHTSKSLEVAAQSMDRIAELAKVCNVAADNAIRTTQTALETVTSTVGGINSTRDTIRETEKRIKRLGERSQEISGVVGLINTIAERTHILALNASMHAASAGEAGRGFAVVADEVQRLAENARQATAQIAALVQNIQAETADTVNTMNTAIAEVVEGAKLAEAAGAQMQLTQATTSELVGFVQQIAASSQAQAKSTGELLNRAQEIKKSAEQTRHQLEAQNEQTTSLVEYARRLLETVRVFRLPA